MSVFVPKRIKTPTNAKNQHEKRAQTQEAVIWRASSVCRQAVLFSIPESKKTEVQTSVFCNSDFLYQLVVDFLGNGQLVLESAGLRLELHIVGLHGAVHCKGKVDLAGNGSRRIGGVHVSG